MNPEILSAISKFSSYALALAVLVWALHTWNEERFNRTAIEDKYRGEMVEVIKTTLQRAHEDQKEDKKLYGLLIDHLSRSERREVEMLQVLTDVKEKVEFQTKSVTGKIQQLQK